jgi:phosphoribosylaminoimidazole (AIR) synthetase
MENVAVLPVPDCACAITSCPVIGGATAEVVAVSGGGECEVAAVVVVVGMAKMARCACVSGRVGRGQSIVSRTLCGTHPCCTNRLVKR